MAKTPRAADEEQVPKNTLDTGAGPSAARDYIIIGGEKRNIGCKCVTYLDDPSWGFAQLVHPDPNSVYINDRKDAAKQPCLTLAQAQSVVDMVVIHSDITASSRDCYRVLKMRGFSTHFMLDWDGTIYQGADPMRKAIHAASELRGDVNNFSVGIDYNCLQMNYASAVGEVDVEKAGLGAQAAAGGTRRMSEVIEINGVPWKSWGYTDAQYDSLIKLLRELNVNFPKIKLTAPVDERGEIIWQVPEALDTEKMGIYGHMHLTPQKFDPGPGMDWPRLLQGLTKEHNEFPVELKKGVTIGSLLTEDKVNQLAEFYYKNTEQDEAGGYYPMGLGGQWHGGVHLHGKKGSEVRAMFDGTVVAARNGKAPELGSNNFVLLRHDVPFDPKDEKKVFTFYSLYMHLLQFDTELDLSNELDKLLPDAPPEWVANARRSVSGKDEEGDDEATKEPAADKPKVEPAKTKAKAAKDKKDGKKAADSKGKAKGKATEGDEDDEDGPKEEPAPYLSVDKHLAALKRGDVALFAADGSDQTRVAAGKLIGKMGTYGEDNEDAGVLHVEVFADGRWRQMVDLLGTHSAHWVELEADTDDNLVVDTEDLLRIVVPDAASRSKRKNTSFVTSRRRVDAEDVKQFYAGDGDDGGRGRVVLRAAITRHVSEWCDQVDWFKTLAAGQGWTERLDSLKKILQDDRGRWRQTVFARQITRQLPYIWLTEEVAKHAGLDTGKEWNGILYHFHPVHFVLWMTFHTNTRLRVLAKGLDKKALMKLREKEKKSQEIKKSAGEWPEEDADEMGDADEGALDVKNPTEVLGELWDVPGMTGDWRRRESADD